ncbi:MAG TPA: hypothetical protein VK453_26680 [Micromonosporaceae bacterium]|nr:hypothetical protein [Micromonosporaceae bacterium]
MSTIDPTPLTTPPPRRGPLATAAVLALVSLLMIVAADLPQTHPTPPYLVPSPAPAPAVVR